MDEITSNMFLKPIILTFAKLSTLLRMFSANCSFESAKLFSLLLKTSLSTILIVLFLLGVN